MNKKFSGKVAAGVLTRALVGASVLLLMVCFGDAVSGGQGIFPVVHAQPVGCSLASLNGTYAVLVEGREFREQGPNIPGGGPSFPVVLLLTLDFDGAGGITGGTGSANFASSVVPNILVSGGTYAVNTDCTGTMSFSVNVPPFLVELDFVIVDNGNEFRFVDTKPTLVESGSGKRMLLDCNVGSPDSLLDGTYGLLYSGHWYPSPPTASTPAQPGVAAFFPAVFAHNLDFDGAGLITGGVGSRNIGTLVRRNISIGSGTYTVNPNCTGHLTFTAPFRLNFDIVLVDGDEFRFVSTTAFAIVAGDAKKQ
ncbi:MAG: hypothetical protein L0212_11785 [Acidobacteria bacterium]|nr:hypothetical protein [Acidobacteriota bacterium]